MLRATLEFSKERFIDSAVPGRTSDARPAALEVAKAGLLPILQSAELPAKNAERLCVAVADWMDALSLIEDEAKLRSER